MKKLFIYLIIFGWSFFGSPLFGQGPPPPPPNPSSDGGPVGGDAPIGDGVVLFLILSVAYATKKYSKMKAKTHLEL